ncbi:unnamed protein product [Haemonchus placei]|uniref:Secreted protein n=1 Tax=Haemonchus placei TaxID=6290 RepID=A0A0N4WP84_HAEPC|nr:unnamed protein product [Haemonchus placei]
MFILLFFFIGEPSSRCANDEGDTFQSLLVSCTDQ